jgi:RraA family protein
MSAATLEDRLQPLTCAALCDVDKGLRFIDPEIRLLNSCTKMIGRALTVKCRDDFLTVLYALHQSESGDVLVIDAGGGKAAVTGELIATEAQRRGLRGIVIDGACRDSATLRKIEIPMFARHVSPMAGTSNRLGKIGGTVSCGGVAVSNGDYIMADCDGIIVVSETELETLLPVAELAHQADAGVFTRMSAGESLFDLLNVVEHAEAIQRGETSSKLKFAT